VSNVFDPPYRVQKADLQPVGGKRPDHVAVDETVIKDHRHRLYAAVDPDANEFLHVKLGTAQNLGLSELLFTELREKHGVFDIVFLVDGAPWHRKHSVATVSDSTTSHTGIGTLSNDHTNR
jgi:transposase-like protein